MNSTESMRMLASTYPNMQMDLVDVTDPTNFIDMSSVCSGQLTPCENPNILIHHFTSQDLLFANQWINRKYMLRCTPTIWFDGYLQAVFVLPIFAGGGVCFIFAVSAVIVYHFRRSYFKDMEAMLALNHAKDTSNQSKSDLLSFICHELRNPLHAILGITHMSLDDSGGSMKEPDTRTILDCALSMKRITDEVLDISRLEHGKIKLESIPFSLRLLLSLVITSFDVTCNTKGVDLQLIIDDATIQEGYFLGDVHRLRQILTNLISNSIKVCMHTYSQITYVFALK